MTLFGKSKAALQHEAVEAKEAAEKAEVEAAAARKAHEKFEAEKAAAKEAEARDMELKQERVNRLKAEREAKEAAKKAMM